MCYTPTNCSVNFLYFIFLLHVLSSTDDLIEFMDHINKKFVNLKYLSMMRNPACPSLMSITGNYTSTLDIFLPFVFQTLPVFSHSAPDIEANKLFRLYVLYRNPQIQILDFEAVTDQEREEAKLRGQFAVKLKRVEEKTGFAAVSEKGPEVDTSFADAQEDIKTGSVEGEDITENRKTFSTHVSKRDVAERRSTKASEGNRFISNGQL